MAKRFSVVGLGKLGGSMAAAIASRGHDVVGVDVNPSAVDALNSGRAPAQETGLDELVGANRARICATMSHETAVLDSELTFVIVPTPSDDRGAFSLQYAAFAFREIGRALKQKHGYHTVVLTSTVLPGACRHGLIPILEKYSGRRCGQDFGFCYSPEFVALGSVIRDFLNPDFLLVGEFDDPSGAQLSDYYRAIVANNAPVARMSLENAELAKISVNAFVTTKITFANMLADICSRIPGGNVDVVSNAIGLDSRIGRKYLTGALGYGGPCFPRDNLALAYFAGAVGATADLPSTTDRLNRSLADRMTAYVVAHASPGSTVAVLGLSYKPASHIVEESQAVALVKALVDRHYRVVAYDPLAGQAANQELRGRALIVDSAEACVSAAEVVLVATPDPEFSGLRATDFSRNGKPAVIIDFWRTLAKTLANEPGVEYVPYGYGRQGDAASEQRVSSLWSDAVAYVGGE